LKEVSYANLGFNYLIKKYSKNGIIVKYYTTSNNFFLFYFFLNVISSHDDKAEFSAAITAVFRVTWSFRNHYNILIWCSRMLKTVALLKISVKTDIGQNIFRII